MTVKSRKARQQLFAVWKIHVFHIVSYVLHTVSYEAVNLLAGITPTEFIIQERFAMYWWRKEETPSRWRNIKKKIQIKIRRQT